MAQDTAKDVRAPVSSVGTSDLSSSAEIHLQLFAGFDFHSAKGQFAIVAQRLDKSIDRPVLAFKAVFGHEVLIDALGRQTELALGVDDFTKRLTLTVARDRLIPRCRNLCLIPRAGWRLGTV